MRMYPYGYADDRLRCLPAGGNVVMTRRNREFDDLSAIAGPPCVGVRPSSTRLQTYELVVIASDVADVVRSAGGWMCDRVRAGWRVTVMLPGEPDIRPLKILGVHALSFDNEYQTMRHSSPAALAVSSRVIDYDERVRRDIQRALLRGTTEVTFWGKLSLLHLDSRIAEVRHRLSCVARAFKTQALITTSAMHPAAGPTEEFRSVAMWYPPHGSDLAPIV